MLFGRGMMVMGSAADRWIEQAIATNWAPLKTFEARIRIRFRFENPTVELHVSAHFAREATTTQSVFSIFPKQPLDPEGALEARSICACPVLQKTPRDIPP